MELRITVERWGPDALLVRLAEEGAGEVGASRCREWVDGWVRLNPCPGLVEVTPGYGTVLLEFEPGERADPRAVQDGLSRWLDGVGPTDPGSGGRTVELEVVYDGPDLARVARHAGMGMDEVVARHSAGRYRVDLLGFAPGFAYLGGLDPRLHTPRLDAPRPRVPAGSVAIGGGHAGVYPVATAGGWNLLGRTEAVLLDLARAAEGRVEAFVLQPGDWVRFVPRGAGRR